MGLAKNKSDKSRHEAAQQPEKLEQKSVFRQIVLLGGAIIILAILALSAFEKRYEGKIYPNVMVGGVASGGKTPKEIEAYWAAQNEPFAASTFEFHFESEIATISGTELNLGYDAGLSATQAYLIGRSKNFLSNLYVKFFQKRVELTPFFRWNTGVVDETLATLAQHIDVQEENALFTFKNVRVTAFKPSKNGRKLNQDLTRKHLEEAFMTVAKGGPLRVVVQLSIETVKPTIATDKVNAFGIKELIGSGYSEFAGSIAGRVHNVALAASRINGVLIKPGETFSFNDTLGDISAATGYQSAYIIKEGRTVLGDGGGVCQVSSTLFRAALNAGLPIVQRQAHAYRVHFYEDGGFKPGLDATVYSPTYDLKFKNDTPGHILIQAKPDTKNLTLVFELYGTSDGRKAEILNHQVWGISPPPPPLYQDDPTLPAGAVKQVDWAAWGAKASFQYKVTRGAEVLQDTTFFSNFRPWQAVYLKGPST